MNLIEFNKILTNPHGIRKDQIAGLQQIIDEYPYFQVAHYLHLNGLKNRRSFKYNDFLKKTAAYTTDRALLFDNITKDDLDIHAAPADLKESMESAVETSPEPKAEPTKAEVFTAESEKSPEETLGVGKPLEFKKDESYSFREWLQLSKFEPIDRGNENHLLKRDAAPYTEKDLKNTDQRQLIDKFIASNPKISPSLSDSYSDASLDSTQENEHLMTETLAHVYVEQKKYEKAITAFTVLSLKYPEKSSFFASQIEAVKKLQEK